MNCPKTLELIKESQELHSQALAQIQKFSDTFSDMRPKNDLSIFTELRKINTEYERIKSQINENLRLIEVLLNPQINIHYTYTNPETNTEFQEDIHIDLEQQIQEHVDFYKQTNIDLPPNFHETALDIWARNYDQIKSQIEQFGFNGVLIVPASIPLEILVTNMCTSDGEENNNQPHKGFYLGDDFKNAGGISTCINIGTDKFRIILYHNKTLPEIEKQNGMDVHLNITAQDAQTLYDKNPSHYLETLEDLIILERITYKPKTNPQETNFHISDWTTNSGQWLPGTKQQGSTRFVLSNWGPGGPALFVNATDAWDSDWALGCRPARYFI